MGGRSKTTSQTYRKREPEPQELTNLRNSLYKMISPVVSGDISEQSDKWKNSMFGKTFLNSLGNVNQASGKRKVMTNALADLTTSGELPKGVSDSMNAAVNSELRKNTGALLNDLASRGVMNSSVANRGLDTLGNNAADAYSKNYLGVYNSVANNLNSGVNTLLGVPAAETAATQAAMGPAYQLWKDWDTLYSGREDYDHVVSQGGGK